MSYIFYIAGNSPASRAAGHTLLRSGFEVSPLPCENVTHLLLPIPSFDDQGNVRGIGPVDSLLDQLSPNVTVIGGNLVHPNLTDYTCIDLLKDPTYLAENASITAYCAIRLAMMELPCTLKDCPVLITGWGRIAQCLAFLLKSMGAAVTIAARKEKSRAIAQALGFGAVSTDDLQPKGFRIIFNTAPTPDLVRCHDANCLKIDLASVKGINGKHVIWARGLPGKDAPETTGNLIAQRIMHYIKEATI